MSTFDPESYLDATLEEPTEKRPPLAAGTYAAALGEPKARGWTSRDGTKSGTAIDVPVEIEHEGQKYVVRDSIMLDVKEDGSIDNSPGANRRLRMYREATGLNVAGQPFSFRMLQGRQVKASINHEMSKDGTETYERVGLVGKA